MWTLGAMNRMRWMASGGSGCPVVGSVFMVVMCAFAFLVEMPRAGFGGAGSARAADNRGGTCPPNSDTAGLE